MDRIPLDESFKPKQSKSGLKLFKNVTYKPDDINHYFQGSFDIEYQTTFKTRVHFNMPPHTDNSLNKIAFVFAHGCGHSSYSFAILSYLMREVYSLPSFAFDFRYHGTYYQNDGQYVMDDLTLVEDMRQIILSIAQKYPDYKFIIVGHSMGGAIASKFVFKYESEPQYQIKALIVLDVVEGSALDALPMMNSIIEGRPTSFKTVKEAVQWATESRTLLNKHSAKLSMPSMIYEDPENMCFKWKCDLKQTAGFWSSWFKGMNDSFLKTGAPKILILAHKDRMDKQLIIEQMQGKFRLVILMREVGHCIMEDEPQELAMKFIEFIDIFKLNVDFKINSVFGQGLAQGQE